MRALLSNPWRLARKMLAMNLAALRDHRERQNFRRLPHDYWDRLPQAVLEEHEPVFFLSTGRCGTQLLTNVLAEEPTLLCHHAPQPELLFSDRMAYQDGRRHFQAYLIAVRAARFELVADSLIRKRRYVETNCRVTFFAPHLAALFPRARFVHLIRHPGEFIRSGVRRAYYQGSYDDVGRIRPLEGSAAAAWPSLDAYQRCAWLWNETNAFVENAKQEIDKDRTLLVRAEDLFTQPETWTRIYEHCGFPAPAASRIAARLRRKVNQQQGGNDVPPHRCWDESLRSKVRRWTPLAPAYGYEL